MNFPLFLFWSSDDKYIKNKNRSQKLKYGLCLREKQIPL